MQAIGQTERRGLAFMRNLPNGSAFADVVDGFDGLESVENHPPRRWPIFVPFEAEELGGAYAAEAFADGGAVHWRLAKGVE